MSDSEIASNWFLTSGMVKYVPVNKRGMSEKDKNRSERGCLTFSILMELDKFDKFINTSLKKYIFKC